MLEPLKDLTTGRNCYQNNLLANQTMRSVLCNIFERVFGLNSKLSLAWTSIIKHNHAAGQFPLQHLPDYKPIGRAVSNESHQQGPPQCHQIASCQNQVFSHSQWEHKVFWSFSVLGFCSPVSQKHSRSSKVVQPVIIPPFCSFCKNLLPRECTITQIAPVWNQSKALDPHRLPIISR